MRRRLIPLITTLMMFTPAAYAEHEYDQGSEYDQWNSEEENRNRNRNRGAFSPGPFEDSPVDFRDNCISLDCGGRDKKDEPQR